MSKKSHYVFYPNPIQKETVDITKILSDLGRPTKRGIRKCFKCGTYNGTRGLMCKNKQCNAIFKECGFKQKIILNAVRLTSSTPRQVFSVRVCDKGPDCRGFVQLPLIQIDDKTNRKNVILSEVTLCFVDSCQRLFDDSILKCHETNKTKENSICIHIKSALKSTSVAVPLEIKTCILNLLNLDDDINHKLWLLYTETDGALVQRVSKTVMAVKCQVTPKHPLGYLHFTFNTTCEEEIGSNFSCNCFPYRDNNYLNDDLISASKKCLHFYACVWAFASDVKLADEFKRFLDIQFGMALPKVSKISTKNQDVQQDQNYSSSAANIFKNSYHINENIIQTTELQL